MVFHLLTLKPKVLTTGYTALKDSAPANSLTWSPTPLVTLFPWLFLKLLRTCFHLRIFAIIVCSAWNSLAANNLMA